jgi:hypothetical protein
MNLSKKQNAPYIYSINNKIINDYLLKNVYRYGKIIMYIYIGEIRAFFGRIALGWHFGEEYDV